MQNPTQFNQFYNQTLQPELQRLDRQRIRLIRILLFSLLGVAGLIVVNTLIGIFVLTLLLSIPVVLYFIYLAKKIRAWVVDFKPKVVRLLIDFIDDGLLFGDFRYEAKQGIPVEKFLESGIFMTRPAEYKAEDYIDGRIGDIEFEMCELYVREFSRVRARLDEVFRGLFLRAKFVHPPKGTLLVIPKKQIPQLSETLKNFVALGGSSVDNAIHHPRFTESYAVYASSDTRIFELLTEQMMDFLLKYQREAGAVSLSFHGKHIYAAIPNNKGILEPRFFQSNVSYSLVKEFYDDIYIALNLIIEFDKAH